MKKTHIILLAALLAAGCAQDFDPDSDSTLCTMTFKFETGSFLDHILVFEDGQFHTGAGGTLTDGYSLRIRSWCYDMSGALVRTDETSLSSLSVAELKVPYVYGSRKYTFFFMADFVRGDQSYWHPLTMSTDSTACMMRSGSDDIPDKYKSAFSARWCGYPIHEPVDIGMEPSTYNGWCILDSLDGLDKLELSLVYRDKLFFKDLSGGKRYVRTSTYYSPTSPISIPLTLTRADYAMKVTVCTKSFSKRDTLSGYLINEGNFPFVLTIHGNTLNNIIQWYE